MLLLFEFDIGKAIGGPVVTDQAVIAISSLTANAVDDTSAASNLIRGMTLTTAAGGAAVAAGILNYPLIGTVADTDNQT